MVLSGYARVPADDEEQLLAAVATQGPVAVAFDAALIMNYRHGIFDAPDCHQWQYNASSSEMHAVIIVGYGEEKGRKYWRVKNSWGTEWGERGYFRIMRGGSGGAMGMCGINHSPAYPLVAPTA